MPNNVLVKFRENAVLGAVLNTMSRNIIDEMRKVVSRDLMFCTPKEAERVVVQNTTFKKPKCRISDCGNVTFDLSVDLNRIRREDYMGINPSTYTSGSTTSLTSSFRSDLSSDFVIDYATTTSSVFPSTSPSISFNASTTIDSRFISAAISKLKIDDGNKVTIELPDGAILEVKENGSYEIKDDQAEVVYKANRIRGFNRFVNASDLLQDFIRFLGTLDVRQGQVLDIPIELFINWLVVKASEQDGEDAPKDITSPENHPRLLEVKEKKTGPKCLFCGKFIRKGLSNKGFNFCDGSHATQFVDSLAVAN